MTARHELDRICRESWSDLGQKFKATSNSMGRVGLSCARRHPALLLGGGALLGFGAVLLLTRGKKNRHSKSSDAKSDDNTRHRVDANEEREDVSEGGESERAKPSMAANFAGGAVVKILKSAARMWLLEHLSSQVRHEPEDKLDSSDLEAHAESAA